MLYKVIQTKRTNYLNQMGTALDFKYVEQPTCYTPKKVRLEFEDGKKYWFGMRQLELVYATPEDKKYWFGQEPVVP